MWALNSLSCRDNVLYLSGDGCPQLFQKSVFGGALIRNGTSVNCKVDQSQEAV